MRAIEVIICCVSMCLVPFAASAQEASQDQTVKRFLLPRDYVSVAILDQPECPLRIEDVVLTASSNRMQEHIARVRNRGSKIVCYYEMASVSSVGTFETWRVKLSTPDQWIRPGETRPATREEMVSGLSPLTDDMRKQLKIKSRLQSVIIYMVLAVRFSDGSQYSDQSMYEALKKHFLEDSN